MPLTIEVPDDIRVALEGQWGDLAHHLRENLAAEGYRAGLLSLAQVRRLLNLPTRWEAQQFLGSHGVAVFDLNDAELDREAKLQAATTPRPK